MSYKLVRDLPVGDEKSRVSDANKLAFSKILRQQRHRGGLSQEELAAKVGVSKITVDRWSVVGHTRLRLIVVP